MNKNTQKFTLDDLSRLVELPKRTIRYYIQQGLVDRPEGAKRGASMSSAIWTSCSRSASGRRQA